MSLALAPAVFTVHFLAAYMLVSLACPAGLEVLVRPGIAAATLAALAIYAGLPLRQQRAAQNGTSAFIGKVNALVCGLSAVATVWVALPAFLLPPCAS